MAIVPPVLAHDYRMVMWVLGWPETLRSTMQVAFRILSDKNTGQVINLGILGAILLSLAIVCAVLWTPTRQLSRKDSGQSP